jgi:hypothetical protein
MRTRHLRFDIPMLADRLIDIADWLQQEPQTRDLKIGWFGEISGSRLCSATNGKGSQRPTDYADNGLFCRIAPFAFVVKYLRLITRDMRYEFLV